MTPTTEDVRFIWIVSQTGCTARAEFDAWLAEHDREVAEKAWDEGAVFGVRDQHGTVDTYIRDAIERHNPYTLTTESF